MRQDKRWNLFKCHRCGRCCSEIGLPYDPEKIFEIAQFLGLSVDQVIEKYYGRISEDNKSWISEDQKRTPCPFLKSDSGVKKTCAIYEVRPEGCRLYPFETDFGREGVDCPAAKIVYKKLYGRNHVKENQDFWLKGVLIMPTYSLQLLNLPGNYKKGTLVHGPIAYIAIKTCSEIKWQNKGGKKPIDFTVISHKCYSLTELEQEINRLIKELESIRKQAKEFFHKDKKKRSNHVLSW